jgi:hypothetical protein
LLAVVAGAGAANGAVGRRLQALAARWAVTGAATATITADGAEHGELESVTADELFDLIDEEFGGMS